MTEKNIAKVPIPEELTKPIEPNQPTIKISRSIGFTINLQDYESARIDATVELSGDIKNKDLMVEYLEQELEAQIKEQIRDVVAQHNPNKTLLGYSRKI